MKKMIRFFIFAAIIVSKVELAAQADGQFANVHAGNVLTGGSASFNKSWYSSSSSFNLYLNAHLQYFVTDRLAFGGVLTIRSFFPADLPTYTSFGIGPAATYYFLMLERLGCYYSESIEYGHFSYSGFDGDHYFIFRTTVGMNYFFTPSAAFGPALDYFSTFQSKADIDLLSLAFAFSIYL